MIPQPSCGTRGNVRDLYVATAAKQGPEERLVRIGYFQIEIFESEFKDIFPWCMTH